MTYRGRVKSTAAARTMQPVTDTVSAGELRAEIARELGRRSSNDATLTWSDERGSVSVDLSQLDVSCRPDWVFISVVLESGNLGRHVMRYELCVPHELRAFKVGVRSHPGNEQNLEHYWGGAIKAAVLNAFDTLIEPSADADGPTDERIAHGIGATAHGLNIFRQ